MWPVKEAKSILNMTKGTIEIIVCLLFRGQRRHRQQKPQREVLAVHSSWRWAKTLDMVVWFTKLKEPFGTAYVCHNQLIFCVIWLGCRSLKLWGLRFSPSLQNWTRWRQKEKNCWEELKLGWVSCESDILWQRCGDEWTNAHRAPFPQSSITENNGTTDAAKVAELESRLAAQLSETERLKVRGMV